MKGSNLIAALTAILAMGCQGRSVDSTSSSSVSRDQLPEIVSGAAPSETEKSKLLAAKDALFTKLSVRLMDALAQGGPASAVAVCQVEAKSIAMEVGKEANVSIGRTGVRLRNTSNQPPAWANKLVAEKIDSAVFAKLSNGHAAALLPIKLQAQCLMCHGPSEQLVPEVKEQLATLYSQDRATGFTEGELRGWFWVESLN
jgi:Protein of unknown function (DUF3365)